ncbi:GerAB/ArcD/ProY family transporter [Allofournierella sp. CML151]|uniref:GerAB/ArcD/ProY family transporter n=1 Tax=Allofournierella sp. CML151 TaxID=2998082 RepID=UPI0022EA3DB7|nr:GerAB/ArcD/ProY family transporter [Fournierella sp. CML151]
MTQNESAFLAPAQLAALMAAALLADVFLQPFGRKAPLLTAQHGILCVAGQMAVFALLLALLRKDAGRALNNKAFCGLLSAAMLVSAALEIIQGERFYSQAMRTGLPVELFLVLLFVAVFYGVYSGLNALARTAVAVLALTAVSMGLLLLSVLPQLRFVNLQPAAINGAEVGGDFVSQFYLAPELILWAILWRPEHSEQADHRPAVVFVWLFAAQALFCLLGEMTLGSAYQQEEQPLFTIARLGGISVFRRLDALHACVWLLLFFVKITLYFSAFTQSIRKVFPALRGHSAYFLAVIGVIGVFLAAWGQAEQTAYLIQQMVCLALLLWLGIVRITVGRKQG